MDANPEEQTANCVTCGREMATAEAIRSDCCPSCDPDTPSAAYTHNKQVK
jgi:predicted RNA-binding Zn-ribbon protein involved in translation (DUF1610 family)